MSSGSTKPLLSIGFRLVRLLTRSTLWADLEDLQTRIDITGSHPPLPTDLAARNRAFPKLCGQPPLGYPTDALGGLGQVESQPVMHDNLFQHGAPIRASRPTRQTSTCSIPKPAFCAPARPQEIRFTSAHLDTRTALLVISRSVPFPLNMFRHLVDLERAAGPREITLILVPRAALDRRHGPTVNA